MSSLSVVFCQKVLPKKRLSVVALVCLSNKFLVLLSVT